MPLLGLNASTLLHPELQKCCLTAVVAAVGAVDVNELKIFNLPYKKNKESAF